MSSSVPVLRHRDFRLLFLGQSASAVGDQVVFVALALYITRSTGSATDLGLVLAAGSLPLIGLVLVGGVWADRLPRHRIMVAADVARALLHGVVAASILLGGASVAELIVVEALFGAARAFFQPAYSGLLPQTIDDALVQDARALTSTSNSLAVLVGPALGTVLVLTAGAGVAFALDAATFVISAALLVPVRPRPRGAPVVREPLVSELRAGWREVRSRPWVWATISAFTGAVLCAYTQWAALAPGVARDVYGGAGVFGVIETVVGAGAVLGAAAGIRWRPRRPLAMGLVLALVWPLQNIAFALGAPLAAVIVLAVGNGVGFSLFEVWWETALVRHIPPAALSRVSSYDWMGSLALMPLGFAVAGPLAAALGARTVLGVGGVIAVVLVALALTPASTRQLGDGRAADPVSAQQVADDVAVEAGGEAEIP
ncbi:MAG TPA: MFS transporter [Solirubrobacteraceae bacterium]|nr:MFS transporter [Solirubrobacteraceae bacterium]